MPVALGKPFSLLGVQCHWRTACRGDVIRVSKVARCGPGAQICEKKDNRNGSRTVDTKEKTTDKYRMLQEVSGINRWFIRGLTNEGDAAARGMTVCIRAAFNTANSAQPIRQSLWNRSDGLRLQEGSRGVRLGVIEFPQQALDVESVEAYLLRHELRQKVAAQSADIKPLRPLPSAATLQAGVISGTASLARGSVGPEILRVGRIARVGTPTSPNCLFRLPTEIPVIF